MAGYHVKFEEFEEAEDCQQSETAKVPESVHRKNGVDCMNPGCNTGACDYCEVCGWNVSEAERRSNLSLVSNENGMRRLFVGIPEEFRKNSSKEEKNGS